jgi:addiction module HigA family antidote
MKMVLREIAMEMYNPAHPGMLIADLLENGSLKVRSVSALARHLGVTRAKLSRVIRGKAAVSADLALLLQDAVGVDVKMWLRLQAQRDLWVASRKRRKKIKRLVVDQPV